MAMAPVDGLEQSFALQRFQQYHGARHRQGQAEDDGRRGRPAPPQRNARTERRGDDHLHHRARQRDLAHRQQVLQREMQAHAEHQQHHTDLGELARDLDVGDEPRGGGPDDNAGQQVAHE
jgi:hypothetical protein